MNFFASWFSDGLMLTAAMIWLILLCYTAKSAWQAFTHYRTVAAALLLMALLWTLHSELTGGQLSGFNYHLIGITLASLMLGPAAAWWLGSLLLLISTLIFHSATDLSTTGLNALALLLPSLIIYRLATYLTQRLPKHIFIYIFINGFFTAAIGMIATGATICSLLSINHSLPATQLWQTAFPIFILLAWGEAFLTGIFTAIFVAFAPHLLTTFDDNNYLNHHNQIWKT